MVRGEERPGIEAEVTSDAFRCAVASILSILHGGCTIAPEYLTEQAAERVVREVAALFPPGGVRIGNRMPPPEALGMQQKDYPYTFSGGTVSVPVQHDPATGEHFFSPEVAQIMYNLTHHLTGLDDVLEAHWKAGFLRGAKFWQGKTNSGTMWQSEQNECWQAANLLWPSVRPESVDDARQVSQANRTGGMALTPAQRSELARSLGIDVDAARRAGVGLGLLDSEAGA